MPLLLFRALLFGWPAVTVIVFDVDPPLQAAAATVLVVVPFGRARPLLRLSAVVTGLRRRRLRLALLAKLPVAHLTLPDPVRGLLFGHSTHVLYLPL